MYSLAQMKDYFYAQNNTWIGKKLVLHWTSNI